MNEFLTFRKMITPTIIQALFWVGVLGCVIGAIGNFGQKMILSGIVMLILGPIMVRVYCELLIVAFKMLESLQEISKNTGKEQPVAQSPLPTTTPGQE